MRNFLFALQFLTTIPLGGNQEKEADLPRATFYFPLVGLLLGLILALLVKFFLILRFNDFTISAFLVIILIILTGALHLDGLADTFDAILSRKDKNTMLAIMRDPHIGVMGVLSLFSLILLKIALLSSIGQALRIPSLILMCVLSRWSMAYAIFLFPYARSEGKAKVFFQGNNIRIIVITALISLACAVIVFKLIGGAIFFITALSAYLIGNYINKKIGGITGDSLGAINELSEIIVLFSVCLLGRLINL